MGTWIKPSKTSIWGNITGDIDNQTDLKTALDNKQDALEGTAGNIVTYSGTKGVVSSATIQDNLTSTSGTDVLSAKQGKELDDKKLSLTGGTMTGEIRCNTSSSIAILGNTDNGAVDICGGTSSITGATLSLAGQDASGDFFLITSKDSKQYTLRGNASNGNLTWGDATIQNSVAIQCDTMPTASASVVNRAYQYLGETTTDYTQGHFYLCVDDGSSTYRWKDLGASSGGEYLSLDGGTMRGEIICDTSSHVAIKNVSDSQSVTIQGGTDYESAYLTLRSKSLGNGFTLSTGVCSLTGNTDGSLYWNGDEIYKATKVTAPSGNWSGDLYLYRYGKMRILVCQCVKFTTSSGNIFALDAKDKPMHYVHAVIASNSSSVALLQVNVANSAGVAYVDFYWGNANTNYFGQVTWFVS